MHPDADRGRPSTRSLRRLRGALFGRALILLATSSLASCGGGDGGPGPTSPEPDPPPAEPSTGSLEVTTSTVAGGLDEDGFRVALEGGEERPIAPDDTVTFEDVAAGDHAVELAGLAAECSVSGESSRSVSVEPDDTATVAFEGTCGLRDWIAFVSTRDDGSEIYVMGADGSNQTRLTENDVIERRPDVSPDGSYIAFGAINGIYVMEADGSNRTRLTEDDVSPGDPSWSPDGSKIAFWDGGNGTFGIYVVDADGSNRTPLFEDDALLESPAWSPDGSRIAFAYDHQDGNREIYVMDADGSNVTRLTEDDAVNSSPAWSPDGSKIAFESDRDGDGAIYVVCSNGSNPPELLAEDARGAAWSPDGSTIAFHTGRDGNSEIYVMGSDGSGPTNLTRKAGGDFRPAWSPQTTGGPGPAPAPSGDCRVAAP